MKSKALKLAFYAVLAIAILAGLAPYMPAAFLRSRVEAALSSSLNRAVNIGDIRFTFFPSGPVPGPGFAFTNVTIHEDPRVGIEPFAYMNEMGASVHILSLLGGRLELSGINLSEASINLVKTDQGQWNFQYLLDSLKAEATSLPAFRMRGGRVNFKFGDTKSVFFFNAADIDISPSITGAMDLRFSGEPSRTDHTKQDFGRFFIRGTSSASSQLNLTIELQRSSLEETLRLMDPQGFGVHGILALNGRVTGAPSQLALTGNVEIGDIHRSDLLPQEGQAWTLPFRGTLDLPGSRFDIESTDPQSEVGMKFHAQDYLSKPVWNAAADFRAMPLTTLFALARHMGSTLPENLTAEGSVSGSAAYAQQTGLTGQLTVNEVSLKLPDNDPLKTASAILNIHDGAVNLAPATIILSPTQTAQIEGNVALTSPHALDLRITTRGLSVSAMRSFGLPNIPIISDTPRGTWSGWARYQNEKWTSESQIRDAALTVDGFAAPVELATATVSLAPNRFAVTRIVGKLGDTAFTGSYEARGASPARFTLVIPETTGEELDRTLAPTLARAGPGLIDRTLRRNTAVPAWLKARRAEGTIEINSVTLADYRVRELRSRLQWDGSMIHLAGTSAQVATANFGGSLDLDLTSPLTKYHLAGTITAIPYRSGLLDVTGTVDAEGSGAQLLQTARADGTAKGRNISFAPDADFRTLNTAFQMQPIGTAPRWKLSNVEVTQGGTTVQGTGMTQEDGQLVLSLGQARYSGALFPPTRVAK
ncbi:MAG: AsmA family protein [Bryobacteraceae bacterium]